MDREIPSPDWDGTWVENAIRAGVAAWTDLHGVLHVFHWTVDGYFELLTRVFGEDFERGTGEPVRDVPHYRTRRQVLVGGCLGAWIRTYRNDIRDEFPGYQRSGERMRRLGARLHVFVVGGLDVDPVSYGQYDSSGRASRTSRRLT